MKVRGHRIELGEIETLLHRHPSVQSCVVTVKQFQIGDHRLVAYIIRKESITPTHRKNNVPAGMDRNIKENRQELGHTLRHFLSSQLYGKWGKNTRFTDSNRPAL